MTLKVGFMYNPMISFWTFDLHHLILHKSFVLSPSPVYIFKMISPPVPCFTPLYLC